MQHPALQAELEPLYSLRAEVRRLAVLQLEREGLEKDPKIKGLFPRD